MYKKGQHIHFVGIGGVGMSGIAEVLLNLGYLISGSDLKRTGVTERLKKLGSTIHYQHRKANIKGADVVVVSSAVGKDNPEVVEARRRLIPVIARAEMLAELMRMKYGIAVAGTHGKTTTTSMIATVLAEGGLDPTVVIGGKLKSLGSGAKLGQGEFLVAEADESDGSFLKLSPTIAVVTGIDPEHLDYYQDFTREKEAFVEFINKLPFYGLAILCLDEVNLQGLLPQLNKTHITYGLTGQADLQARNIELKPIKTSFTVYWKGKKLGPLSIGIPGLHNVNNSLATAATAMELDLSFKVIQKALKGFSGIERRFEMKGEAKGILVVDDYGHHPQEIKATLAAAKNTWNRRLVVVFQPHRYTRTRDLYFEFLPAFHQADVLIITGIYPAGEKKLPGVSAEGLYRGICGHGHKDATFIPELKEISNHLPGILRPGDMVITLGAGDVGQVADELLKALKKDRKRRK